MAVILIAGAIPDLPPVLPSLLRDKGHDVHITNSYSKLWATIAVLRPALIVIDEMMKSHNGRKFCRDIKQNKNTQHIAVLLVTDNVGSAGYADAILQRPLDDTLFYDAVQQILEKS